MLSPPPALQQVDHVFEKFDVAALIGGDGDALGVFLQGGVDDFLHRAVMAEMDDLHAGGLEDAAHDVDGGIVAVKERGGGDETDFVGGLVQVCGAGRVFHLGLHVRVVVQRKNGSAHGVRRSNGGEKKKLAEHKATGRNTQNISA